MPTFTIGIPTYNRSKWLKTAIESALSQSHKDVRVIVSDNASTDDTSTVVRKFGSRVEYARFEANMGATANFCHLVELASGDYFSWLQDDNSIFGQFAERAIVCLEANRRATVYGAFAAASGPMNILAYSRLNGPPVCLDWVAGNPRTVDGDLMAPLSLCGGVIPMPVMAFRLEALRDCMSRWDHAIPLFVERIMLSNVAAKGEVVFDPYVAGVLRSHTQSHQQFDADATKLQWLAMARTLNTIPTGPDRVQRLTKLLEDVDEPKQAWGQESQSWPTEIEICREMREAITGKPQ